jgi:filamentous hemagglutinin
VAIVATTGFVGIIASKFNRLRKLFGGKAEEVATPAAKGKYANRTNINYRSAKDVNADFDGYNPPYKSGTRVTEYNTIEADQFVRVHGENNAARSWMMRREAIEGLSPQEIARKYSLPEVPAKISDINVPAGARIRTGKVAENFSGNEGAIQYQWLGRVPESAITNTRYLQVK